MKQDEISQKNAEFWSELCGSQLARSIGVTDSSVASLKKSDDWYFDFYPYLFDHIPFSKLKDKNVLEIGLGYGTVAQRIAESGAFYTGLDIAAGPVAMVNHRLQQNSLSGKALQGSILDPPFAPESFDTIIAIGCLHHTGDLAAAISHCHRLLRTGGSFIFMVYYAYSYRRWSQAPRNTFRYLFDEMNGERRVVGVAESKDRAAYDTNSAGEGAPHTDWISRKSLAVYCQEFSSFKSAIENIDSEAPFKPWSRSQLLKTKIPFLMGLDLYATAQK
jgi:SAM-dependent methyltransferase